MYIDSLASYTLILFNKLTGRGGSSSELGLLSHGNVWAVLQCLHSGYKLLLQLPRESMSSLFCLCVLLNWKLKCHAIDFYTHDKNGMRQFTNVGKWYFCQLGISPQENLLMTKLFARPAINVYNALAESS